MFDFLEKQYDEDRIENGVWLHFLDKEGEPLYIDGPPVYASDGVTVIKGGTKPSRALVRSILSKAYDKMGDDSLKSMSAKSRSLKSEAQRRLAALAEMKGQDPKACSILVVKFENISLVKPGELTPSPADIIHFAKQPKNAPWVKQIIDFAGDNVNYGGETSPAVEEGKGDAAE